ncbi:MAG: hypothetical protein OEY12_18070, partial [Nitrospira sp.]|nr:hypothetical protein [Nitrospira sp.]
KSFCDQLRVRVHAANDYLAFGQVPAKKQGRFKTSNCRHHEVQHHYVRTQAERLCYCHASVRSCAYHFAHRIRQSTEIRQDVWMIVG